MADVTSTDVQKERDERAADDRDTIKQAQRDYAERTYGKPAAEAGNAPDVALDSLKDIPTKTESDKTAKAVKDASKETDD